MRHQIERGEIARDIARIEIGGGCGGAQAQPLRR